MSISKKLLNDLNCHVLQRYGGWQSLVQSYATIYILCKTSGRVLIYLSDKKHNTQPPESNEAKKENLTRRERLKKYFRKILPTRGGAIPSSLVYDIAKSLVFDTSFLASVGLFLKGRIWKDLDVSVYDIYMSSGSVRKIEETFDDGCTGVDSLLAYLLVTLRDDQSPLSREEQAERIYRQLFKSRKMRLNWKNAKYIAIVLGCIAGFLTTFKQSGMGGTYDAFFIAFIRAIRDGTIPKSIARRILRRLKLNKLVVPDELEELLS